MTEPRIRYATRGGMHIAHTVLGDGDLDLLFLMEWIGNLEVQLEEPRIREFLDRLASFSRLILLDKRGTGLSDPLVGDQLPSFDDWMDDLEAVLDAVSSRRAVVVALGGAAPMALTFAATHPERVASLVLVNAFARLARAPDHPWGMPEHVHERVVAQAEEEWGQGVHLAPSIAPAAVGDPDWEHYWQRVQRAAASPGTAANLYRMAYRSDARHVLGAVQAPTLVIHLAGDPYVRVEHGRDLAERIADARYVEIDSVAHMPWVHDTDEVLAEIQQFVTGRAPHVPTSRMLATVLMSDIVGSTAQLAELGDTAWSHLLERHRQDAERQVRRFEGVMVNWMGDGFVARFDRPSAAAQCASALHAVAGRADLQLRVGVHTGEIEVSPDDISGLAVHLAARLCDRAGPGQTLVTATVRDLAIGSGIEFAPQGNRELDGVPGSWEVFHAVAT